MRLDALEAWLIGVSRLDVELLHWGADYGAHYSARIGSGGMNAHDYTWKTDSACARNIAEFGPRHARAGGQR